MLLVHLLNMADLWIKFWIFLSFLVFGIFGICITFFSGESSTLVLVILIVATSGMNDLTKLGFYCL